MAGRCRARRVHSIGNTGPDDRAEPASARAATPPRGRGLQPDRLVTQVRHPVRRVGQGGGGLAVDRIAGAGELRQIDVVIVEAKALLNPPSNLRGPSYAREMILAITKLEEARMWAEKCQSIPDTFPNP